MTDWPNHAEAWRAWRDALGGERMHHGWLLAGKAALAMQPVPAARGFQQHREGGVLGNLDMGDGVHHHDDVQRHGGTCQARC